MADHRIMMGEVDEKAASSKKRSQPASERLKKHDELQEQNRLEQPPVDASGVLLSDARFSQLTGADQRARMLTGLQRKHGNAYVQRLLASTAVQAKLTVSHPDDKYEQEADSVAESVVRMADSQVQRQEEEELLQGKTEAIQRQPEEEEEEEEIQPKAVQRQEEEELLQGKAVQRQEEEEELQAKAIQRQPEEEEEPVQAKALQRQEEEEEVQAKALLRQAEPEEEELLQGKALQRQEEEEEVQAKPAGSQPNEVGDVLEQRIEAARGGGGPLPDSVRTQLEPAFGRDFDDVRVHTDANAGTLSRDLEARAFTTGSDIFFRDGDYQPESEAGKKLIAHELTHVVQQTGSAGREIAGDEQSDIGRKITRGRRR